jgi:chemotaxis protein histidine kinase CheA/methyl-accepting chemotaxis protein
MRLQTKLNFVSLLILLLDGACHISIGAYVITKILYNLNRNILASELHTRVAKIAEGYQILKDTGLEGAEAYVKASQNVVFDGLKDYRYGATGGIVIFGPDKKVLSGMSDDRNGEAAGAGAAYIDEMMAKKSGSIEFIQNGREQYAAFETFAPWKWTIALSVSTEEMLANRSSYLKRVSLLAVFILLLNTLMLRGVGKRLTRKVEASLVTLKKVEGGDLGARIPNVINDDEIGAIQTEINSMISVIQVRNEELARARDTLEVRVQERSRELKEQLRNSSNLLNNMRQVVFAIDQEGTIIPPVSKSAELVFGMPIEGKNVFDIIFKQMDRASEAFAALNTAFIAVFDEGATQWRVMESCFPKSLTYQNAGKERTLKVGYSPMWNDHGLVERIMLVIEDITNVIELEKNVAAVKATASKNMSMTQELGANEPDELEFFFNSSYTLLSEARNRVSNGATDAYSVCMRNMHTLKGNARIFGLSQISTAAHEAEALMAGLGASMIVIAHDIFADVQGSVFEYADLARRIYRMANGFHDKLLSEVHSIATGADLYISEWCGGSERPNLRQSVANSLRKLQISAKSIKSSEIMTLSEALIHMVAKQDCDRKEVSERWNVLAGAVRAVLVSTPMFREISNDIEMWVATILRLEACSRLNRTERHEECVIALKELATHCAAHHLNYLEGLCSWTGDTIRTPEQRGLGIRSAWSYVKFVSMIQSSHVLEKSSLAKAIAAAESNECDNKVLSDLVFGRVIKVLSSRPGGIRSFFEMTESQTKDWFASDHQLEPLRKILAVFSTSRSLSQILNSCREIAPDADSSGLLTSLCALLEDGGGGLFAVPYLKSLAAAQLLNSSFAQSGTSVTTRTRLLEVTEKNYHKFRQRLLEWNQAFPHQNFDELFLEFDHLTDVPIKPSIQRMGLMVRDIASRLEKDVEFKVMGGDPVLSREKLTLLSDALVHIIRNSIDHGIESRDERQKLGKSEEGTIAVECAESDQGVILRIWDDGRGIAGEEVAKAAVAKGLIDQAQLKNLDDNQKLNLVFLDGLSTKSDVTEISGRGIGMSVVKANIESIGGAIEIRSRVGQGTEITVKLKSVPATVHAEAA